MKCNEKDSADPTDSDLAKKKLVSPGFLISLVRLGQPLPVPGPLAAPGEMEVEARSGGEDRAGGQKRRSVGSCPVNY